MSKRDKITPERIEQVRKHGNGKEASLRIAAVRKLDVKKAFNIIDNCGMAEAARADKYEVLFKAGALPADEVLRVAYLVALRRGRDFICAAEMKKFKAFADASRSKHFDSKDIGEFSWKNFYYRRMLDGEKAGQFKNARGPLADLGLKIRKKGEEDGE